MAVIRYVVGEGIRASLERSSSAVNANIIGVVMLNVNSAGRHSI